MIAAHFIQVREIVSIVIYLYGGSTLKEIPLARDSKAKAFAVYEFG